MTEKEIDVEYIDIVLNTSPLPEHRLIYAILYRTAKDLFGADPKFRRSAVKFILSKNIKPFSFRWCCSQINLNYQILIDLFHKHKHAPIDNELTQLLNGKQLINQHSFLQSTLPKLSLF